VTAAIALIAILLLVCAAVAAGYRRSRGKSLPAVHTPDEPLFLAHPPGLAESPGGAFAADRGAADGAGPGFRVVSVTGGTLPPAGRRDPAAKSPAATGFSFVTVSENPTAICKLTGDQVRTCTCDKHRGRSR
jgi:hypothetical protein